MRLASFATWTTCRPASPAAARAQLPAAGRSSCQSAGIKLFRFSSEDCRFGNRLEDDILSFLGKDTEGFIDSGLLLGRDVELYEHQEGALEEMARKRD